jgi:PKD repeat protein
MRSIRLLAGATAALILGSACGGGDGPPTDNDDTQAPVAAFTAPTCTVGTACAFTADPSTDNVGVTGWGWDFSGDGSNEFTTKDASFTFTAAGSVPVRLIVSDAAGLADTVINNVTVNPAAPGNTAPVSSFVLPVDCRAGTPCGFHSTSTDPDAGGSIEFSAWDFGDDATGEGDDATHTYADPGTYTVTLTVTDDQGAQGVSSQQLTVAAPAIQDCTTTGTLVDCTFTPTARVTMKVIVATTDCELSGNRITATTAATPTPQTVFFNLCNQPDNAEYEIKDGNGAVRVFEAGESLALRLTQGTPGPGDPPAGDPGIQVTGAYPTWTLHVDDGGAAGTTGEPDFNDAVLTVQATIAP